MPSLKHGWQQTVAAYLSARDEPLIAANLVAEVFGLDSDVLSTDEYNALMRAMHRAGWRKRSVWVPPSERAA
jgi:hypothetical protein